ncbi:MAG: hypothetical protein BWX61_01475 [Bacteroidetes bacterium ADurb.Bin035]|nr:MAG: hypothetical protein BWX61_01475 [Bacteroidetes bacterium ADurb.Bin035]
MLLSSATNPDLSLPFLRYSKAFRLYSILFSYCPKVLYRYPKYEYDIPIRLSLFSFFDFSKISVKRSSASLYLLISIKFRAKFI